YVSLEQRLPPPRPTFRPESLPDAAAERLTRLEEKVREEESFYRTWALRQLHEEKMNLFINSPGFGVARFYRPVADRLEDKRPEAIIPQPGSLSVGEPAAPGRSVENFDRLHLLSVADFVNPHGFGFVKDRRHVAGFQPHQFSE